MRRLAALTLMALAGAAGITGFALMIYGVSEAGVMDANGELLRPFQGIAISLGGAALAGTAIQAGRRTCDRYDGDKFDVEGDFLMLVCVIWFAGVAAVAAWFASRLI